MKMLNSGNSSLFFVGVIVILILLGVSVWFLINTKRWDDNFSPRAVRIGEKEYVLEISDTETKREKGLGGRDNLCAECGMFFVFEKPGRYAFWMKDMRFPLDIIWLAGDKVVFIVHDVKSDFSGIIEPNVLADRVIEVNANAASALNIGELVEFLR